MSETLTDVQLDLIFFIERFHGTQGVAPTRNQIKARFAVTDEMLNDFEENTLVQRSFNARGIIYPTGEDAFTPEQMHAAAVMTDLVDRRSDAKKLADLGVSSRQWATWIQDERFAAYLRDRSERLLTNSVHEAHKGLLKGVRNGNVAAVKAYYEVTGRYRPNEEAQVDVRRILFTFIEVIQKYVKDPIILHRISQDLTGIATSESYAENLSRQMTAPSFVQGSVVPTEPAIRAPSPLEIEDDL